MKTILKNRYLIFLLRVALGVYFLYAASAKIIQPAEFATAIRDYQLIPDLLSNIPAVMIPWLEFYCGLFLLLGLFTSSAAVTAFTLMGVFTLAVVSALLRGLEIDCGCGVSLAGVQQVSWLKVAENAGIMAVLYWVAVVPARFAGLDRFRKSAGK